MYSVLRDFDIDISNTQIKKLVNTIIAFIGVFLYLNPNNYFNISCFKIERNGLRKNNLFCVSTKDNFNSIEEVLYKVLTENVEEETLKEILAEYITDSVEYSLEENEKFGV
jgi:ABC-type glycerol-3-phosphate transport system permease component